MNMERVNRSVNKFNEGYACSQAILSEYGESLGLDRDLALKISSGFAGGMRRGETCGAVTGAFMVLGLIFCGDDSDKIEGRKNIYGAVSEFTQAFEQHHGTVLCKALLGCDIGTPEGMSAAKEGNLFQTKCPQFVETAATLLDRMIQTGVLESLSEHKGK